MGKRLIFTLVWSAMLWYATFPELFSGEMSMSFMSDCAGMKANSFTYIMTVTMFILDVAYNMFVVNSTLKNVPMIFSMLFVYLASFAFAIHSESGWLFVVGWIALAMMKFFSLDDKVEPMTEIDEG